MHDELAAVPSDEPIDTLPRGVRVIRIVLVTMAIECALLAGVVLHALGQI